MADNKEENATKFKKISEAYSILNDPKKRSNYDRFGKQNGNMDEEWDGGHFFKEEQPISSNRIRSC